MIAIGEIVKAQGIHGELKVVPMTHSLRRFGEVKRVYFQGTSGLQEFQIESYRPFKQFVLVKLAGVSDRSQAISLGQGLLCIPRSERPQPPPGQYYYDQIEGLEVYTLAGIYLGEIQQVIETGANDLYLVRNKKGAHGGIAASGKDLYIPALKNIIKEISLDTGRMIVDPPPGLLEV